LADILDKCCDEILADWQQTSTSASLPDWATMLDVLVGK
jgi:hypothetical protein